jgi:hypothetical protein
MNDVDNLIQHIGFSMKMEDMPLTDGGDKNCLRNRIMEEEAINEVL